MICLHMGIFLAKITAQKMSLAKFFLFSCGGFKMVVHKFSNLPYMFKTEKRENRSTLMFIEVILYLIVPRWCSTMDSGADTEFKQSGPDFRFRPRDCQYHKGIQKYPLLEVKFPIILYFVHWELLPPRDTALRNHCAIVH